MQFKNVSDGYKRIMATKTYLATGVGALNYYSEVEVEEFMDGKFFTYYVFIDIGESKFYAVSKDSVFDMDDYSYCIESYQNIDDTKGSRFSKAFEIAEANLENLGKEI